MNVELRKQLIAAGFNPTQYEGRDGEFLTKALKASEMPYFSKHVVDNEYVLETDTIIVEVCPGGLVQLVDQDTDYIEEGVPLDSEEGKALLRDAGFAI